MNQTKSPGSPTPLLFIAGLALGAAVTALFTPRSGEEMRRTIKDKADGVKESLANKAEKTADVAQQKIEENKPSVRKANKDKQNQETPENLPPPS